MPDNKVAVGNIHITYSVDCPHCGENYNCFDENEWFECTMGADFPVDNNSWDATYEAVCQECKKEFLIEGFQT